MEEKIPLIVVAGPTASGKTALGVALAKAVGGEVVSADSMQIYKGLSIATAKPTKEETDGVPHHLVDFLDPGEPFSLADYLEAARQTIRKIASKGKIPLLVGGTGLYINSVIDGIELGEGGSDPAFREMLRQKAKRYGNVFLVQMLAEFDPDSAKRLHPNNVGRIIRAIEIYHLTGKTMTAHIEDSRRKDSPYRLCYLGIQFSRRQILYDRIDQRVDQMVAAGLVEEVFEASKQSLSTAAQAIGYKELLPYFSGECSLQDAIAQIKQSSRRYAKRQLSWFRRDDRIVWLYPDREDILKKSLEHIEKSGLL